MHVEFNVPDHAHLIELLLEGFVRAGEVLIRAGACPWRPSLDIVLRDDDVPSWKLPPETDESKVADCEDLVIYWAAALRATGRDPSARARLKTTGPLQTHCLLFTRGRAVDVYEEHLAAQRKRAAATGGEEFELGGFMSFVKSVGHGIADAGRAVGRGASSAAHGVATAGRAVGHAAQYVAKELPKDILHEAGSGLKSVAGGVADFVHDVGSAGSTGVNALGDVVAGGAQDALHQVGKLVGGVGNSFSGGLGDDSRAYNGGASADQGGVDAAGGDMETEVPAGYGGPAGEWPQASDAWDGEDPWAGMTEADGVADDDDAFSDENEEDVTE